ncbi:MAG: glycoside hydrolase family 95 protein [Lentisphaeria bacterium]|nr:glycoside hydrolase family 95 protein [Lentisphaeria bacterium]
MSCTIFSTKESGSFLESFPIGNGDLGAMIGGGLARDILPLNEITLWSSRKHDCTNPLAKESLPKIRELFFAGRYEEANTLAKEKLLRKDYGDGCAAELPFGAYLPLGELELFFDQYRIQYASPYRRELDLETGIASVSYLLPGQKFLREYFVSGPDRILVVKASSEGPEGMDLRIRLTRPKDAFLPRITENGILLEGAVSGGRRFAAGLRVISADGTCTAHEDHLELRATHEFHLLLAGATDFFGEDPAEKVQKTLAKVQVIPYAELRKRHAEDFTAVSRRMRLQIGEERSEPFEAERLAEFLADPDREGEAFSMFFRFGRYLFQSSCRGRLPATIQCLWNGDYKPPWNSDYHLNANTQMIYWPAEKIGLSEGTDALFRWMKVLAAEGKNVAEKVFGARGWCASWISNPFGYAAPGGDIQWGLFPEAGGWMCRHIREHYEYTQDKEFLAEYYPLLRGACEFCLDMLSQDPGSGKLLFGPTVPPEHGFLTENDKRCFVVWGSTAGQEIVYDLFDFTLKSSAELGNDEAFRAKLQEALELLALPGRDEEGRISPWIRTLKSDGSRHFRHTYGHFPGERISEEKTPEMIEPLKRTIEDQKESSRKAYWGAGSWSGVWLLHHYAKLGMAEQAYECLKLLMAKTTAPNLFTLNGGVFQADGILGSVSGIADMLLQSTGGILRLLPALPAAWKNGEVSGLHARGNFLVSMRWKEGHAVSIGIRAETGGVCRLALADMEKTFEMKKGDVLLLDGNLNPLR